MTYVVIEFQTAADGTVSYLISTYTSRNEAESKYHTILSFAATSSVPSHTAVLTTNEGQLIERKTYRHATIEVEPEEYVEPGDEP